MFGCCRWGLMGLLKYTIQCTSMTRMAKRCGHPASPIRVVPEKNPCAGRNVRLGSNEATEPVLVSPVPPNMAGIQLCPSTFRPAGSANLDLHATKCDKYTSRTDYPCSLQWCLPPTQTLGHLPRDIFDSRRASHQPNLVDQRCWTGMTCILYFD